ncbi:MAG TPA: hypothetical protein DD413_02730 [Ruminococcus sp.]|nr:hypothetical protein [Ruminococcus sp.]
MNKKTKFLSVVLALVLAISAFTVMSLAVNAAEEDDYWDISESTMDTPTESVVDHIELVNLPETTEYIKETDWDFSKNNILLDGLEFNVYFSDGTEKHIVCTESVDYYSEELHIQFFDSEGNKFDDLSESGEYTVRISYYIFNGDVSDYESDCEVCEYTINVIEDPFNSTVKSIEIIKLPNKVFTAPYISSEDCKSQQEYFDMLNDNSIQYNMNGAQMKINFTDGTSDVYNFDKPNGFGLVSFEYEGRYITVNDLGNYKAEVEFAGKTTVFEVNHTGANSSAIVKVELTKLPDKVFTEPLFTDYFIPPKQGESLDLDEANKSIALNMKGAELTYYYANGESGVYVFDDYVYYGFDVSDRLLAAYTTELDEPYSQIAVTDLGNYKAKISFDPVGGSVDLEYEFSVKTNNETDSTITGNPANGNLASSDTAKSSTSDTATSDSVINGNTDNGAIATGSVMYSVVAIIVLVSACGVLAFFNRKRYLSK